MKLYCLGLFFIIFVSGCSSVPNVKLKKENFEQLQTVKLEASPNDNSMLSAISTVEVQWTGVSYHHFGIASDGLGVRELALQFMDEHQISLNEIVQNQFIEKVNADNLKIRFDSNSQNKLVITLNVVVLGMVHGFSDEFNSRFNIAAQLFDSAGNIIWSYNAIPISPVAPGYSIKLKTLFSSKESMMKFFNAASEPIVQKLYDDFKRDLM
ncbi:hypothetical protein Q4567_18590 [Aliiglaciecola sp. 2_MG-2023]|uniref:hypothetical protein n=1 Tax=Alteromonadaceae TaxID=72275 RepID=UPI0026E11672|nr:MULTISPECIES: hypothetical protein [unclassified Aliiglaciecola]MDO6712749.1 hypothetical protein [Aliiglaciecola sp. 2_MG-2023]MDO6753852.1 hypothetical protein [Aliiglaciecola sp. 1_MG-2023]